ncbi:MAG: carboxypeptidase-like regulatory domain-containing protein [Acidobacteriota bacterium]
MSLLPALARQRLQRITFTCFVASVLVIQAPVPVSADPPPGVDAEASRIHQRHRLEQRYESLARQLELLSPTVDRGALSRVGSTDQEVKARLLALDRPGSRLLQVAVGALDAIARRSASSAWGAELVGSGSISGTVTEQGSGLPIEDSFIALFDESSGIVDGAVTDGQGDYLLSDLPAGEYFISVESSDYFDELYDDLPCLPFDCVFTTGTPVVVAEGAIAAGIDFELQTGGVITGRVTEEETGQPIDSSQGLILVDDQNRPLSSRSTTDGVYRYAGLATGNYYVLTSFDNYADELFDDIPCPTGCIGTMPTPIAVNFGSTTSGIDFQLTRGGEILGRVTDQTTGEPLANSGVFVYAPAGWTINAQPTDSDGNFRLAGLGTGHYFVSASAVGYGRKLYESLPCPEDCDVTTGTPVDVIFDAETVDIDFSLEGLDLLFADGFESGDTSAWTITLP